MRTLLFFFHRSESSLEKFFQLKTRPLCFMKQQDAQTRVKKVAIQKDGRKKKTTVYADQKRKKKKEYIYIVKFCGGRLF